MKLLIPVFVTIVIIHLFYNYLVLPLLREKFKYQLFALRDEFRRYEKENRENVNSELLEYLKKTINKMINMVEIFDMSIIIIVIRALKNDTQLHIIIENYNDLFKNYATEEIKKIEKRKIQIALNIFYINTIEMALCIMPVLILANIIGYSFSQCKKIVRDFANLPEEHVLCNQ